LPSKCNKSELNAGLSLKANSSDVQRTIGEIISQAENKPGYEEIEGLMEEKVNKTDL
jgi:hypothetical protein